MNIFAIRSNKSTGDCTAVEVDLSLSPDGREWRLSGGVTGHEGFNNDDDHLGRVMTKYGWRACLGTPGRYDGLWVPVEEMQRAVGQVRNLAEIPLYDPGDEALVTNPDDPFGPPIPFYAVSGGRRHPENPQPFRPTTHGVKNEVCEDGSVIALRFDGTVGRTSKDAVPELLVELTEMLKMANEAYYKGSPIMDDMEFDFMLKELETLEKARPDLAAPDSPTQKVGA